MRLFAAILLSLTLAAQERRFGVQSRLVPVPAMVFDAKGRPVDGLEPEDFTVLDNGRPRPVVVDTADTAVAPVALVIAVQSSGISGPVLAKVWKIGALIQPLITGERGCAAVVSFAETVNWLEGCTSDPDAVSTALRRIRPGEEKRGRMLDAVREAVARLEAQTNARRVLLLISESRDRGSEAELESVVAAAQNAGVAIYGATYSAMKTGFTASRADYETPGQRKRAPLPSEAPGAMPGEEKGKLPPPEQRFDILGSIVELVRLGSTKTTEVLTVATGGATFSFARQKTLEAALTRLGEELHSGYLLSFVPEGAEPGYHKIDVRLTRRGDCRVRARPAYWFAEDGVERASDPAR